jgi:hypothetical protein
VSLSPMTGSPDTRRGGPQSPEEIPRVPWNQLGPEFFAAWGRPNGVPMAEHMSVYGPSGSGKTHFVAYILTERARLRGTHMVMVATKKADATLLKAGWPIVKSWPPPYGKDQVIWWARGGLRADDQERQAERVQTLMHALWEPDSNRVVAWDELPYVCADLGLRRPIATYYREGRALGISNVAAMQRPSDVPRYVHSEVSWTVSFKPKDQDDRDRVAEVFGNRNLYREVLAGLSREHHEFVIKRELTGEAFISSLPSKMPALPAKPRRW